MSFRLRRPDDLNLAMHAEIANREKIEIKFVIFQLVSYSVNVPEEQANRAEIPDIFQWVMV